MECWVSIYKINIKKKKEEKEEKERKKGEENEYMLHSI
jgi:hypothetical protein